MSKITIEKAETELAELKEAFESVDIRIRENNGRKSRMWLMNIRGSIYNLERKIEDLKAGKVRTDKLTPEDIRMEKRVEKLEESIKNIEQGK